MRARERARGSKKGQLARDRRARLCGGLLRPSRARVRPVGLIRDHCGRPLNVVPSLEGGGSLESRWAVLPVGARLDRCALVLAPSLSLGGLPKPQRVSIPSGSTPAPASSPPASCCEMGEMGRGAAELLGPHSRAVRRAPRRRRAGQGRGDGEGGRRGARRCIEQQARQGLTLPASGEQSRRGKNTLGAERAPRAGIPRPVVFPLQMNTHPLQFTGLCFLGLGLALDSHSGLSLDRATAMSWYPPPPPHYAQDYAGAGYPPQPHPYGGSPAAPPPGYAAPPPQPQGGYPPYGGHYAQPPTTGYYQPPPAAYPQPQQPMMHHHHQQPRYPDYAAPAPAPPPPVQHQYTPPPPPVTAPPPPLKEGELRPPPDVAHDPNSFRRYFKQQLDHLTYNSKPVITSLTLFAHEHAIRMASVVAQCFDEHLRTVSRGDQGTGCFFSPLSRARCKPKTVHLSSSKGKTSVLEHLLFKGVGLGLCPFFFAIRLLAGGGGKTCFFVYPQRTHTRRVKHAPFRSLPEQRSRCAG